MNQHGTSEESLFRVDRPREAVRAFCASEEGGFYWQKIKANYETEIKGKITDDTARNILYFLAQFGFCAKQGDRPAYLSTAAGTRVCQALKSGSEFEYRRAIAEVLLAQNLKSKLFTRFREFLGESRRKDEITEAFERTGSTLLAWGLESGLILEADGRYYAVRKRFENVEEFWIAVNEAYERKSKSGSRTRSMFVRISEVYFSIQPGLDKSDPHYDFKKWMAALLKDSRFSRQVELSGAPESYVEEQDLMPIEHNKRRYYYLAITSQR